MTKDRFIFLVMVLAAVACIVNLVTGCRTYYVYQYGLGDNEILVDAEVEKEINPTVKASLK
jgi:hypothetical protein